jgi:hypothetical protein
VAARKGHSHMNAIYTLGYGGGYYPAALQQVQNMARDGVIIDTRHVPHTKLVGFDQEDLQREYGLRYIHISALGNRNYKGGPIALVDEEEGLRQLEDWLARFPILLLCGCTDVVKCHRRYIANKLRERTGAPICHLLTSYREHEVRTEPAPDRLEEWTRATTRPVEEKKPEDPAPFAQLSLFDPGEPIQPTTTTQAVDWSGETIAKPDNPCILLYGAGPEGKQCKDCASLVCFTASRNFYKCRQRPKLTHGAATDQKVRWPACKRFEPRTGDIPLYDGRG